MHIHTHRRLAHTHAYTHTQVSGSEDGTLVLYDVQSGVALRSVNLQSGAICAICISGEGDLAVATIDGTVHAISVNGELSQGALTRTPTRAPSPKPSPSPSNPRPHPPTLTLAQASSSERHVYTCT